MGLTYHAYLKYKYYFTIVLNIDSVFSYTIL